MKLEKGFENQNGTHLGYCTNIHAAESWQELYPQLQQHLPGIRDSVCRQQRLGLGLRLSAKALADLEQPEHFEEIQALLGDNYYLYTINGFPYGTFHNTPVKEQVYSPDWSDRARLDYSNGLAHLMSRLLPVSTPGTISTVPGTFKPWMPGRVEAVTHHLLEHVACLVDIKKQSGCQIMMTLEPEPFCMLETIAETVDYFEQHLFSKQSIKVLAKLCGDSESLAEQSIREHIGVCYDVCHAAVEFENPKQSVKTLLDAGIAIGKLQISSALRLPNVDEHTAETLAPFDEPVYLHQVIQRKDDELTRYLDVSEALANIDQATGSEWRCHFHVPVFLDELEHFSTTQDFLIEILDLQRNEPFTQHLEIETYTWDVLPEAYRKVNIGNAISRELEWVKERLQS